MKRDGGELCRLGDENASIQSSLFFKKWTIVVGVYACWCVRAIVHRALLVCICSRRKACTSRMRRNVERDGRERCLGSLNLLCIFYQKIKKILQRVHMLCTHAYLVERAHDLSAKVRLKVVVHHVSDHQPRRRSLHRRRCSIRHCRSVSMNDNP